MDHLPIFYGWMFIHSTIQLDMANTGKNSIVRCSFNQFATQVPHSWVNDYIAESKTAIIHFVLIAFALDNVLYFDSSF